CMDDFLLADGLFLQQPAFEQLAIVSVKIEAKAELGKETRGQVTPTGQYLSEPAGRNSNAANFSWPARVWRTNLDTRLRLAVMLMGLGNPTRRLPGLAAGCQRRTRADVGCAERCAGKRDRGVFCCGILDEPGEWLHGNSPKQHPRDAANQSGHPA